MEELIKQMYKLMASDDFADSIASMLWNIYTKAKGKGFTDEQAMAITLGFVKSQSANK